MTALDPDGAGPARNAFLALAALLLALRFLTGCGSTEPPPIWIALARGFEPRPLAELVAEWETAEQERAGPTGTRAEPQPPGMSLRLDVAAGLWRPSETPGCFTLELPAGAFRASGVRPRLIGRGREYHRAEAGRAPLPGEIRMEGDRLVLRLAADAGQVVPPSVLVIERAGGSASEHALPSSAWRVGSQTGAFWVELPSAATNEASVRLFAELVRVEAPRALAPFEYQVGAGGLDEEGTLTLCWPEGEAPPTAQLAARLENGRTVEGQWQLRLGRFCATGIPVWSGAREELVVDLPRASQLHFRFAHASPASARAVTARIRLAGEVLFERSFASGSWSEPQAFTLALPPEGRAGARLAFEVEGPSGLGAFFTPTIGPRELGTPRARPWPARPDLVLFLADTLRADCLEPYGGEPDLAPHLARFARESLCFARARSSAAWTLPSIASLLTGLHPGQHGATDEDLTLPAFHTTIAEELARAGYRTGAITDGSFFAPVFGLDQGFEWFAEHDSAHWDLDQTVAEARAFLEQDDGRPLFLVVHTYRVHQPYRVGPHEDSSAYDELMAKARVVAGTNSPAPAAGLELLGHYESELRALYHAGVRDLDRGFGLFLAALEARRFFERGVLVLTSDHGEALGENHDFFHGGHLWETKLRVPLFLKGPGIVPRTVHSPAGLLDLAPTFAELAGLPLDPDWAGSSLLALQVERPAFAFQLGVKGRRLALIEGERKVILSPDGQELERGACEEAFDLARDPREEHDLAREADWPAELARRLAAVTRGFLQARGPAERAGVTSEQRDQLDALGYGGPSK